MASWSHNGKKARTSATAAGSSDVGQDQTGEFLTTAQALRLPDTDHPLRPRARPRVVRARGAAAHGIFASYGTGRPVTKTAAVHPVLTS
jgi:catalase